MDSVLGSSSCGLALEAASRLELEVLVMQPSVPSQLLRRLRQQQ